MGTFFFSGTFGHITQVFTNPYDSQTISVDSDFYINDSTYFGDAGETDLLLLTDERDALFLIDEDDDQFFDSIEIFVGSNGGDFLHFASNTHVLMNLFIFADDGDDIVWSNAGDDTIYGGEGNDILHGGPGHDQIEGEGGNDTIYGWVGTDTLLGGDGDDTLRGGTDADVLNGGNGVDTADYSTSTAGVQVNLLTGTGLGGDAQGDTLSDIENVTGSGHADHITGNTANNELRGGLGNDTLIGGAGNDVLYGGDSDNVIMNNHDFVDSVEFPHLMERVNILDLTPPGDVALGIANDNLDIDFQTTGSITFRQGFAGYNNTLGVYRIADDGTMQAASILWENVKDAGIDVSHDFTLPLEAAGGKIGFFIISDGDNQNNYNGLDTGTAGNIKFIYDYGKVTQRVATIDDPGSKVCVVYDDGTTLVKLKGSHYHTTDRGGDTDINSDGASHIVSGVVSENGDEVLRIGFEDLKNLGDADYEDVLFDVTIDSDIPTTFTGDVLIGGAGNDTLYGGNGSDVLVVGDSLDHIYGEAGQDLIVFDTMDSMVDIIHGFTTGSSGDVLNITDILQGYDAISDTISDFVRLVNVGGNTELQVNQDGDSGGVFAALAIFQGGISGTLQNLIDNGNLVADQSAVY